MLLRLLVYIFKPLVMPSSQMRECNSTSQLMFRVHPYNFASLHVNCYWGFFPGLRAIAPGQEGLIRFWHYRTGFSSFSLLFFLDRGNASAKKKHVYMEHKSTRCTARQLIEAFNKSKLLARTMGIHHLIKLLVLRVSPFWRPTDAARHAEIRSGPRGSSPGFYRGAVRARSTLQ